MDAAQFGSLDCLNILLKHGANVELEELAVDGGGTGWTAMYANQALCAPVLLLPNLVYTRVERTGTSRQ